jgi:RNA polymerase sigma-70 factor, ECF subfamily
MLVDQIVAGDRRAMQMLYSKHHMRVYRFLRGLVRDEELTEDLVSEVFLKCLAEGEKEYERKFAETWERMLPALHGRRVD